MQTVLAVKCVALMDAAILVSNLLYQMSPAFAIGRLVVITGHSTPLTDVPYASAETENLC